MSRLFGKLTCRDTFFFFHLVCFLRKEKKVHWTQCIVICVLVTAELTSLVKFAFHYQTYWKMRSVVSTCKS